MRRPTCASECQSSCQAVAGQIATTKASAHTITHSYLVHRRVRLCVYRSMRQSGGDVSTMTSQQQQRPARQQQQQQQNTATTTPTPIATPHILLARSKLQRQTSKPATASVVHIYAKRQIRQNELVASYSEPLLPLLQRRRSRRRRRQTSARD